MRYAICLIALGLGACSLTPSQRAEAAWQTLNLVDMAQTDHLTQAPECRSESNPLTQALVGEHPSRAEAAAVGIAYAAGYRFVSSWLDGKVEDDPSKRWMRTAWHAVGIVTKAATVISNHRHGLNIGGAGCEEPRLAVAGPHTPIM